MEVAPYLTGAEYFRFSEAEYARRRALVSDIVAAAAADCLLAHGARSARTGINYLVNWQPTREALLLFEPQTSHSSLVVQLGNHTACAERMSVDAEVRFGGSNAHGAVDSLPATVELVHERGLAGARFAVSGTLPADFGRRLREELPRATFVDVSRAVQRAQVAKSEEELAVIRYAASLSDRAVERISSEIGPGSTEYDVAALIDHTHASGGGQSTVRFLASTSMDAPDVAVPLQYPRNRVLRAGDVLFAEISASVAGYTGQVLRSWTVAADPTPHYAALHDVAQSVFDSVVDRLRPGTSSRELVEATATVEERGFSVWDDVVHGFGQTPPIVRTRGSHRGIDDDFRIEEGMVVVVQPNVVAADRHSGVQTGEMVVVNADGATSLHTAPRGFLRCAS